ncbi:MAG: sulfite exporter TauE/SafE family protein [Fusobacterium sp.]
MAIIIIVNIIVGCLVGLTGVAGFLLPMLYVSLNYNVKEALALSFFAFLVCGVIGSINYYKHKQLNISFGIKLGISSLFGACLGVYLNSMIDESIVKILLYMVVLLSGISILLRKDRESLNNKTPNIFIIILIGFVTAIVCALSGAGGPILVMPLLVVLGVNVKQAIALFDSIFIAIPSVIGYMQGSYSNSLLIVLLISSFFHGVGVFIGSKYSVKVNHLIIKRCVAIISIFVALYKLFA